MAKRMLDELGSGPRQGGALSPHGAFRVPGLHSHADIMPTVLEFLERVRPNEFPLGPSRTALGTIGLAGRSVFMPHLSDASLPVARAANEECANFQKQPGLYDSSSCSIEMFGKRKLAFVLSFANESDSVFASLPQKNEHIRKVIVTYKGCDEMIILAVEEFDLTEDPEEKINLWRPPRNALDLMKSSWYLGLRRFAFSCRVGAAVMHQQSRRGEDALRRWAERLARCVEGASGQRISRDLVLARALEANRTAREAPQLVASPASTSDSPRPSAHYQQFSMECHATWFAYTDPK